MAMKIRFDSTCFFLSIGLIHPG